MQALSAPGNHEVVVDDFVVPACGLFRDSLELCYATDTMLEKDHNLP